MSKLSDATRTAFDPDDGGAIQPKTASNCSLGSLLVGKTSFDGDGPVNPKGMSDVQLIGRSGMLSEDFMWRKCPSIEDVDDF